MKSHTHECEDCHSIMDLTMVKNHYMYVCYFCDNKKKDRGEEE